MSRWRRRGWFVSLLMGAVAMCSGAAAATGSAAHASATGWTIMSSPAVSGGELLGVAALNGTDAWAVGTKAVNGVFSPLAEHWNGNDWTVVPMPAPSNFNEVYAVAMVSSSDVWAVGVTSNWSGLIEHWNGSSWQVVPSPITGSQTPLYGVYALAANNVWAAGQNGTHGTLLHYDGTSWSVVAHPEPSGSTYTTFSKVAGTSATDIWAVGESQTSTQQTLVEHFDGSSWTIVPSATQGAYNYVRGLSVLNGGDAWLVGDSESAAPNYTEHPMIQHWSGSSWTAVRTRVGEPWGVAALSATDAWLVGNKTTSTGYTNLIEKWNGSTWNTIQGPSLGSGDNELNGITALPGGTLWAVGSYEPNGTTQPVIETNPSG
ncbi:MAG: hypothetical protein ACJ75G_05235 [Gaiellaceae bacterium]